MQFMTGLISTAPAPVVPAAPATPAAPAASDDAGDVAAIITALAAPESSGASAAPLQGPAMCRSCKMGLKCDKKAAQVSKSVLFG